ncbi:MAG: DnaJ domain-containing protein [Candidatus Riflebacteria bacterium]
MAINLKQQKGSLTGMVFFKVKKNFEANLKLLICFTFLACYSIVFSQTSAQIEVYNRLFYEKKYAEAKESLLQIFSENKDNIDFHREKAKLNAFLGETSEFLKEIGWLRDTNHHDSVATIMVVVNHPEIRKEQRDLVFSFFKARQDIFMLSALGKTSHLVPPTNSTFNQIPPANLCYEQKEPDPGPEIVSEEIATKSQIVTVEIPNSETKIAEIESPVPTKSEPKSTPQKANISEETPFLNKTTLYFFLFISILSLILSVTGKFSLYLDFTDAAVTILGVVLPAIVYFILDSILGAPVETTIIISLVTFVSILIFTCRASSRANIDPILTIISLFGKYSFAALYAFLMLLLALTGPGSKRKDESNQDFEMRFKREQAFSNAALSFSTGLFVGLVYLTTKNHNWSSPREYFGETAQQQNTIQEEIPNFSPNNKSDNNESKTETAKKNSSVDEKISKALKTLKLPTGSKKKDVDKAFRELAHKCHPDKVAHLCQEVQDAAHKTFVDLRSAYHFLKENLPD